MANRFVLSHIRNLPLLAKLLPGQLELLTDIVEVVQLPANALVFQQGQAAQGLYLLVSGHAVLYTGQSGSETVLGEVQENQYVGETALFRIANERMSMRVTRPSVLLLLPRLRFQQLLLEKPELRQAFSHEQVRLDPQSGRNFQGQRVGENRLLHQHRHRWAFIRSAILPVVIGLVLIVIAFLLSNTGLTLPLLMLALIIPGLWIFYAYLEWKNDYLIITDQRVMLHQQTILTLTSSIREVLISSVHEVSYKIPSVDPFARVFNYGTIYIKTAGEAGNMEISLMPNPEQIQKVLITTLHAYRNVSDQQDIDAIGAVIDRVVLSETDAAPPEPQTQSTSHIPPLAGQRRGLLNERHVDEHNNVIFRKHLSVWLAHVMLPGLFVLGGMALVGVGLLSLSPLGGIEALIGLFIALIGSVWFYWSDWDWRNDLLILGTSTIRIIHRRPLWLQDVAEEVLLEQVDDASVIRNGLLNTVLNRGDLSISLVGDDRPKRFTGVGSPDAVKNAIFERRAVLERRTQESELMQQRQEIARYLDVYHQRVNGQAAQQPPQNPPPNYAPPAYPPQASPPPPPAQPPDNRQGSRPPRIPRTRNDQS
ncbi:MAG: hypothetical protein CL610_20425 [Anaerolineaceae bacterium]|nr:hypothetical protein [Anaerolineaceae bacterium]